MLHPALYKLIQLQFRANVRRILRGARSPGPILVLILGALIAVGWLILASSLTLKHPTDPNRVRAVMPLALLGVCIVTVITSVGDKAIAFTPGEVDQLFPGPFSRRELIGYKLLKSTLGALLTAGVLSILMLRHARWWPACFVAVFLSLLFVQYFSIVLLLAGQAIGEAAYSRVRQVVMLTAAALVFVAARPWISRGFSGAAMESAVYQFNDSAIGNALLSPFRSFGQLMTATTAGALIVPSFYALVLIGGLGGLVMLMDSFYVETAMVASERRYAKIQRMRGGSFLSVGVSGVRHWQLPPFPFAAGVGPIAWRQMTNAMRSSRGLLILTAITAIFASLMLREGGVHAVQQLLSVMAFVTFLSSTMLNFDFRGDVDLIESLKALPLKSSSVVIGQLIVPVVLLTLFHAALLLIAMSFVPSEHGKFVAVLVLVVPFNALLFEVENLIFLLFPSRPAAVSPGDFQMLGRKFVFLVAKTVVISTACFVAALFAVVAWVLTSRSLPAGIAAGWIIMMGFVVGTVPLVAWAYRRFDPSLHTPA